MFGGNDPFGGMFRQMQMQMNEMDRVFENMMDPFMLAPNRQGMNQIQPAIMNMGNGGNMGNMGNSVSPFHQVPRFGGFGFGGMFDPMSMIQRQMTMGPNCQVFSHSSTTTFDEYGRPKVVERTMKSNGDTREERRRYCDGEREETAVQQTIGERTHIVEKKRDKDGKIRRQQKLINLDESNVDDFTEEFSARFHKPRNSRPSGSRGPVMQSIGYNQPTTAPPSVRVSENAPIITLPEEDEVPSESDRYSSHQGPVIREITEEEESLSNNPKRRRGQ